MIWLLTKIFSPLTPFYNFVGDHRYGTVAFFLIVVAVAAWAYVPVAGRKIAAALIVAAVAAGFFDWGYSYRAEIDRKAWTAVEAERVRLVIVERARREDAIAKARREAELAEIALKSQQEEHARYMVEMESASKAANNNPCLSGPSVMRLDRIGRRKKAR